MSYYFAIIGTLDNPLFTYEFGTSKSGGDGIARFREEQRRMNQFIVHASLDIVEEVQWANGNMYVYSDCLYLESAGLRRRESGCRQQSQDGILSRKSN
jgi:Sedlin, N-terminal conserved region